MLSTIAGLFGKSPFNPFILHMDKVALCIEKLNELFSLLENKQFEKIPRCIDAISSLEHAADSAKNSIRNNLPKTILLPVPRHNVLEMISLQDSIADTAERIAHTFNLLPLEDITLWTHSVLPVYKKSIESFELIHEIVHMLQELLEASFRGIKVEHTKALIDKISFKKHAVDLLYHSTLASFFKEAKDAHHTVFYVITTLLEEIHALSHIAEKLAMQIRIIIDTK